jgi:hypothetical protein
LLLQPLFNDDALLFSHRHAPLELFLYYWILCDKSGRQAGDANFLDAQAVTSRHGDC